MNYLVRRMVDNGILTEKNCGSRVIVMILLGRHSLMARPQETVSVFVF